MHISERFSPDFPKMLYPKTISEQISISIPSPLPGQWLNFIIFIIITPPRRHHRRQATFLPFQTISTSTTTSSRRSVSFLSFRNDKDDDGDDDAFDVPNSAAFPSKGKAQGEGENTEDLIKKFFPPEHHLPKAAGRSPSFPALHPWTPEPKDTILFYDLI